MKRHRVIASLLVIIMTVALISGMVLPAKASYSGVEIELELPFTYEQFLAKYYLEYSQLEFLMSNDEIPYHTFIKDPDGDMEKKVEAWRKATFSAADHATYTSKEVGFYVLLLYDVIYQRVSEDSGLKNFNSMADGIMASTMADLAKTSAEGALELTPEFDIDDDNWEEVLKTMVKGESLKLLSERTGTLLKCVKYVGTVEDLSNKLAMLEEFLYCTDEVKAILQDIKDEADDEVLKQAVAEMCGVASGLMTEEEIQKIFSGEVIGNEITDYALGKLWDATKAIPIVGGLTAGVELGQKVGKLASNFLCSTDAIVENWYSMRKVYEFECTLKGVLEDYISAYERNPSQENAIRLNKAAEMYCATMSVGMEYACKYAEAAKGGGLLGWLYKTFNKDKYDDMMKSLEWIKDNIDDQMDFTSNETYNFYLDALEEAMMEENMVVPAMEKTPCEVTYKEIVESQETFSDYVFTLTNQTVEEDTSYVEDKETYANYTLREGTLNLNGQTLTVGGDFYLKGGTVDLDGGVLDIAGDLYVEGGTLVLDSGTVNVGGNMIQSGGISEIYHGTLNVSGDYRIQRVYLDTAGNEAYEGCAGILRMVNEDDVVNVGGSFVTQSNMYTNSSVSSYNAFSAGTMYVGGDFIQLGDYWSCFEASGTHKVVLNGGDEAKVRLDHKDATFNELEVSEQRKLTFENYIGIEKLLSDLDVTAKNLHIVDTKLNGHTVNITGDVSVSGLTLQKGYLTISGDVTVTGNVNVAKGNLAISGNLIQSNGIFAIDGGELNVSRDYRIQRAYLDAAGDIAYESSVGILRMLNETDVVNVGGSFVTQSGMYTNSSVSSYNAFSAGTMYVGGDFIQLGDYWSCFEATGSHKVVLNGTDKQKVELEHSDNHFNILQLTNHKENYTFNREPCWNTLEAPQMTYAVSAEPTTEADGVLHGTCTHCDKVEDVVLPKLNAEEYAITTVAEATCTEPETLQYKWNVTEYGEFVFEVKTTTVPHSYVNGVCEFCQNPEPGCEHEIVIDAAVGATCSATGLTEGQHCSVCNEVLVKQEVVPMKEHTEVVDEPKEATCTASGLTEGKHCSVCEAVIVKQETIPAKGHSFEDGVCEVCEAKDPDYVAPTPTVQPTVEPTVAPTPTVQPTVEPTVEPIPTVQPSVEPTVEPTPTVQPTVEPTVAPTPTVQPTVEPTVAPTPTVQPTVEPTVAPTPTVQPTVEPTAAPTPTVQPTVEPTVAPTPTVQPTVTPVVTPTPTVKPTVTPAPTPVIDNPFKDVKEADWFYNPVMWAYENSVTGGTSATTFGPNDGCTRAQVVTFLWAANGKPEPETTENSFTDVKESDWFYKPVLWAVENGITSGISADKFGPDQICTRAQIVTFLYAAVEKPEIEGNSTFKDVKDTDWFAKPVIWAAQNDVTGGIGDGKFGPNNTCTRGQVVTFLYKVYGVEVQ